jgi:hypothetical protein
MVAAWESDMCSVAVTGRAVMTCLALRPCTLTYWEGAAPGRNVCVHQDTIGWVPI